MNEYKLNGKNNQSNLWYRIQRYQYQFSSSCMMMDPVVILMPVRDGVWYQYYSFTCGTGCGIQGRLGRFFSFYYFECFNFVTLLHWMFFFTENGILYQHHQKNVNVIVMYHYSSGTEKATPSFSRVSLSRSPPSIARVSVTACLGVGGFVF